MCLAENFKLLSDLDCIAIVQCWSKARVTCASMHMHIVEESMQKKGRVIEGMGMSQEDILPCGSLIRAQSHHYAASWEKFHNVRALDRDPRGKNSRDFQDMWLHMRIEYDQLGNRGRKV